VSLENPETDAQKKINQIIPTTLADLIGRWEGDSTYTVDDIRATSLVHLGVKFEIYDDSSLEIKDPQHLVFANNMIGKVQLVGDSIFLTAYSNYKISPDTFITKIRFLGNRLELEHSADARFSFFHKRKWVDSIFQDSVLRDSLWLLQSKQLRPDSIHLESQLENFTYFKFSDDSMNCDLHRNGIIQFEPGTFSKKGKIWKRATSSGTREYIAELSAMDTLRLWPLVAGRPDSGFDLYVHQHTNHPNDIDLQPFFTYLRSDSILIADRLVENHYGQFFDMKISKDHGVQIFTNMAEFPNYKKWTLATGKLSLVAENNEHIELQIDSSKTTRSKLTTSINSVYHQNTSFFMTRVDGTRFTTFPLERFEQASYVHIIANQDTSHFYFLPNYAKGSPEKFEILEKDNNDTAFVTFTLLPNQDSYQNGQPGFHFVMGGKNSALGHYVCQALANNNLVIRTEVAKDPNWAQGTIQGDCKIITAEKVYTDSTLSITGIFKVKRKITSTSMLSPYWSL